MFGRRVRPQLSELYEARIADLKEAHQAQIDEMHKAIAMLVEQIEYLRMTGGVTPLRASTAPVAHRPPMSPPPYMSEEEEDLRSMAENELLDEQQLRAALADLGVEP